MKLKKIYFIVITLISLSGCLAVDSKIYRQVTVDFEHGGNLLSGSLILPENRSSPFPVAVFVHGDGAIPYDAHGYYRPLWKQLAKQGIASFSWDKAGVGKSQGDWQNQSMDDRADEAISAINILKEHAEIAPNNIGLIGYSQAGWVLPLVAKKSNYPDFMILVSGAINWMDQGAYMTKIRLTREGFSDTEIKQEIEKFRNITKQLFSASSTYEEYRDYYRVIATEGDKEELMTPQRFQFVKLNWRSDARESLKEIKLPTLAIFGGHDLNVDAAESANVYKEMFEESGNEDLTIKLFPDAQHGLLKQKYFKEVVPGIGFIIKFELLGEDAFVDGYLDFVVDWIKGKTK